MYSSKNTKNNVRLFVEQLDQRLTPSATSFDPNTVLVQFKPLVNMRPDQLSLIPGTRVSNEIAPLLVPGLRKITFDGSVLNVQNVLATYQASNLVKFAELDILGSIQLTPNDTNYNQMFALNNTGQTGGTADADMDAPEAWDLATGTGSVVVADLDTGTQLDHPDLIQNIWVNPGEIAGNAVDDDNNGFVDDINGWDFVNNDNDPSDDNGHGTHTAGTIGARGNNGQGVTGVIWNTKIMTLKVFNAGGGGAQSNAIAALNYAVAKGVKVSNNSYQFGTAFSNAFFTAISNARTQGHIFVAAAGNFAQDNDVVLLKPASYDLDNIISVAATTHTDDLASFSSYGATTVDIGAPGENILSTVMGSGYGLNSGTSMATPQVAGAVALVKDRFPGLTYDDVITKIYNAVDLIPSMTTKVKTNGRLNLFKALQTPVAPVANNDNNPAIYTTNEDTVLTVNALGVLSNDVYGFPPDIEIVSGPLNGTLTGGIVNPDGSFVYTPNLNYFGTDSFTYRLRDPFNVSGTATVSLTINSVNDRPVANDNLYIARPGVPLLVNPSGVLGNDTDVENNPLTARLIASPQKASSFTLNADGSFTYVGLPGSKGDDQFFYVANDGFADSTNTAKVRIHINNLTINRSDRYTTTFNTPLNVPIVTQGVLGNDFDPDGDPLTVQLVAAPSSGTLILNPNGTFNYTPAAGFAGDVDFTYRTFDGFENGPDTNVIISVDRKPIADPDFYFVQQNRDITVEYPGVLSNDSDPDTGDLLTAVLKTSPQYGTLEFASNGFFRYTPNLGFSGTDTFTYAASDGKILLDGSRVQSDVTIVTLNVLEAPLAKNDIYISYGPTLTVPGTTGLLANDTNPNNRPRVTLLDSSPKFGTLTLNPDGSFVYAAANGFVGIESFTYHVNDGIFNSNVATVNLIINPTNRAPVAVNDSYSTDFNAPLNVLPSGVLVNDSDPDVGQTLVPILISGTSNGHLVLNPNGGFTYSPLDGFSGVDSFTYKVSDGITESNLATVTIRVGNAIVGDPKARIVIAGETGDGTFRVLAGETGEQIFAIQPYANYTGAIRVATGDVTGDGIPDIITAPGALTTAQKALPVMLFDGETGNSLGFSAHPFGTTYKGGIQVASGDVNGDGFADIVVSADAANATTQVRVFNGVTNKLFTNWLGGFKPYTGTAFGGVRIAVGDVNGDGKADIITAPGAGTPVVRVYNSAAGSQAAGLIRSFNAFSSAVTGGVYVATGVLNGQASIVVGAHTQTAGTPPVRIFNALTGTTFKSITPAGTGPSRVAVGDVNGDGKLDIIVGRNGTPSRARFYDAATLSEFFGSSENYIFDPLYNGAVFLAALGKV